MQRDAAVAGARPVDLDRDGVEELLVGEAGDEVGRERGGGSAAAVAQLVGAHQEEVAPGPVLGAVAELLERLRLELLGLGVVGVGEDEVVDDLGDPAEVAALERLARVREHRVGAAGQLDVALAGGLGRMRPQVRRVAVEPARGSAGRPP